MHHRVYRVCPFAGRLTKAMAEVWKCVGDETEQRTTMESPGMTSCAHASRGRFYKRAEGGFTVITRARTLSGTQ